MFIIGQGSYRPPNSLRPAVETNVMVPGDDSEKAVALGAGVVLSARLPQPATYVSANGRMMLCMVESSVFTMMGFSLTVVPVPSHSQNMAPRRAPPSSIDWAEAS